MRLICRGQRAHARHSRRLGEESSSGWRITFEKHTGSSAFVTRVRADRALLCAEPAAATRVGRGESRLASGARDRNRDHRVRERVAARARRRALRALCWSPCHRADISDGDLRRNLEAHRRARRQRRAAPLRARYAAPDPKAERRKLGASCAAGGPTCQGQQRCRRRFSCGGRHRRSILVLTTLETLPGAPADSLPVATSRDLSRPGAIIGEHRAMR